MTPALERLLARLEGVKQLGPGSWMTRCCVHQERTPSLHITEFRDGTTLFYCFGCGADGQDVAEAAGIPIAHFFPPRDTPDWGRAGGSLPRPPPQDLLAAAAHEALIVAMATETQWRGEDLSLEEEDRLMLAVLRLREFAERVAA